MRRARAHDPAHLRRGGHRHRHPDREDDAGATATATATILAEAPVQGTSDLRAGVTAIGLPAKVVAGMTDKLDAAIAAMNQNSRKTAITNLNAVISLVKVQQGRTLSIEQAAALIAEAPLIGKSL